MYIGVLRCVVILLRCDDIVLKCDVIVLRCGAVFSGVKSLSAGVILLFSDVVLLLSGVIVFFRTGVALMYYDLYRKYRYGDADANLERAVYYINGAVKNLRHRGVSFLCGDAGPLAVAAIIYHATGHVDKTKDALSRWED